MKQQNVVVMGGSFNPPTIAHMQIMQQALDVLEADRGYFVPVSFAYLKRKMIKAGEGHLCLPDELRLNMLRAMIQADERIQIDTQEMGEPCAITQKTMKTAQERHPDAKIYFVAGADKIPMLEDFVRKWNFLKQYGAIVFSRDKNDVMEEIARHELLAAFQSAIVPIVPPQAIEGISSTQVRKHLFDVDAVADMLHPDVTKMLRQLKPEDFPEEIIGFKDGFAFLSNDYPVSVTYEGLSYPCANSAFLASKYADASKRAEIARMKPEKAKQKYGAETGDADWESRKIAIMDEIVRNKFSQHPDLSEQLVNTGSRKLIAGGKNGGFWGVDLYTWEGENRLGILLMNLRKDLKEEKTYEV